MSNATRGGRLFRPLLSKRWAYHGCLILSALGTAAALIVWPQWVALEGSRQALLIQVERTTALEDRLEQLRALTGQLREWNQLERRVMLAGELDAFPASVAAAGEQSGVRHTAVQVTNQAAPRWRNHAVQAGVWTAQTTSAAGEVRPVWVKVVLRGDFDSIYRTVATLCGGTHLFVPDRWDLSPEAGSDDGGLHAEIWATVFVASPGDSDDQPAPTPPAAVLGKLDALGGSDRTNTPVQVGREG